MTTGRLIREEDHGFPTDKRQRAYLRKQYLARLGIAMLNLRSMRNTQEIRRKWPEIRSRPQQKGLDGDRDWGLSNGQVMDETSGVYEDV